MSGGRLLLAAALTAVTLASTGTAHALTPANGGSVGGATIAVNAGPGDQSEPHVSGDLAVYTERVSIFAPGTIHYYDFGTGTDGVVPGGAPGDSDILSDVNGSRIVFSRTRSSDNATAIMLFDASSGVLTELGPRDPESMRFGAVIGGGIVAYADFAAVGAGDIFVYDLAAGTATNLTQSSFELDINAAVSPAGDVVVWERCIGSNCDILQSVRAGQVWGPPTVVAAPAPSSESNPDTDGTTVAYDSERTSATGQDIYFRSVLGGPETALELAGPQRNPSISNGVIAFESKSSPETPADVWIYVIATNTLFRVNDTPTVDETLNDVTRLPDGALRVVWAANDDLEPGLHNVYARTFTVPLTSDTVPPTLALPASLTVDATSPAGATVSFAVSASDDADPSPVVACTPASGSVFPIGTSTVSCTASDHAGNEATGSFTVTVLGAKEQLARLIQEVVAASGLPATVKAQLLARVQPFLAAFDPSDPAQRWAVCSGLNTFAAVLRLLSGHGVSPAQATAWIADANRIRAVIGC